MKVLVLPDIHGRRFWVEPCKKVDNYEKIIFLGDYFDPYKFEDISFSDCIDNFKEIINFKKNNIDKVVLLIGNHDLPYYSDEYYHFSWYHCRHSSSFHDEIAELFEKNRKLLQLSCVVEDVLFTHAGVESGWLSNVVKCDETDINKISDNINLLLHQKNGMEKLYCITSERGGRDRYGSCVWTDVHDMMWDNDVITKKPINNIKQVFGHTMQAFYNEKRDIVFGEAKEFELCKMIDTAKPYELDIENFKINVAK